MPAIDEGQVEALGRLADKADNLIAASKMPLPDRVHVACLAVGMVEIRDALKTIVRDVSGEDPWADASESGEP